MFDFAARFAQEVSDAPGGKILSEAVNGGKIIGEA
jgi:hypothetical protein